MQRRASASGFKLALPWACLILSAASLWAQIPKSDSEGNVPGGNEAAGAANSRTSRTEAGSRQGTSQSSSRDAGQNDSSQESDHHQPIYLYGRVVTDGGEPPPERVLVRMDCGSGSMPQDYTDAKGRFSFVPSSNQPLATIDASISDARTFGSRGGFSPGALGSRSGSFRLSGCALHAELSGYRSDQVPLRDIRGLGGNNVGLIVLHRLDGLLGTTVSATSLTAPKAAAKSYQRGLRELRRKDPRYRRSIAHLEKAVDAYPEFAAAWSALGEAWRGVGDTASARQAFRRALESDPRFLRPYEELIEMAGRRKDWPALEALGGDYLALVPNAPKVRLMVAAAALSQGKIDRAEEMAQGIAARNGADQWPVSHSILGLVHESRGDFSNAAERYRAYLRSAPDASDAEQVRKKLYEWEALRVIEPQ